MNLKKPSFIFQRCSKTILFYMTYCLLLYATCHLIVFFFKKRMGDIQAKEKKTKEKSGMQAYLCRPKHVAFLFNWPNTLAYLVLDANFFWAFKFLPSYI